MHLRIENRAFCIWCKRYRVVAGVALFLCRPYDLTLPCDMNSVSNNADSLCTMKMLTQLASWNPQVCKFEGHKKRTWSVDFAPTNPVPFGRNPLSCCSPISVWA